MFKRSLRAYNVRSMHGITIIERAFQVAPECGSVEEVKRRLMREGYFSVQAHLSGPRIRAQLNERLDPELRAALKAVTASANG
jgi:hypothetical protein